MSAKFPEDMPETMAAGVTSAPMPVAPANSRGRKGLAPRPEQTFEKRRRVFFFSIALVVIAGALFIYQHVSAPLDVTGMMVVPEKKAPGGVVVMPTMTPVTIVFPTSASAPLAAAVVNGALTCLANRDVLTDQGTIPADAEVPVTGYTAAKGGLVEVYAQWFALAWFRCVGDVRQLERPYVIAVTPTRVRSSALADVQAPSSAAVPTLVPYPTPLPLPTSTPVDGIWWVGPNCWQVNLQAVREIWVDGKGVSNGTYCGVGEFRVVVGGQ